MNILYFYLSLISKSFILATSADETFVLILPAFPASIFGITAGISATCIPSSSININVTISLSNVSFPVL